MTLPTTTELLLRWDAQRPRSRQQAMGMSKLGSCRRQAGYHLQGYPQDVGYEDSGIQNVIGTSLHETAAEAAQMFLPDALAEEIEVRFGGLVGHPDLYLDGVVRDIKTVGYAMQLEQRRQNGPPLRERYQVHTYGAGLRMAGWAVHTVQIDYIDRGSGEEYLFEEPWDVEVVREAMAWLEQVRTTSVSLLSRDYRPESAFCEHCPWFRQCWNAEPGKDPRSVLFRDDPDAARWMGQLAGAQAARKRAGEDEADAKGALDVLRTVSRPGESEVVAVPGAERAVKFTVRKGRVSPDIPRISVDYRNAGARPPMKYGEPTIGVSLVKRDDGDAQ